MRKRQEIENLVRSKKYLNFSEGQLGFHLRLMLKSNFMSGEFGVAIAVENFIENQLHKIEGKGL